MRVVPLFYGLSIETALHERARAFVVLFPLVRIFCTAFTQQLMETPIIPKEKSGSQSLAPLMGAPVESGTAANGAIVNKAALRAYAKTFPPRSETVQITDNICVIQTPNVNAAFIVGDD